MRLHLHNTSARLILRHTHIPINCGTECCKTSASNRRRLRTCLHRQRAPCQAPCTNTIIQVVLRPKLLDCAFGSCVYAADHAKILCGRPRRATDLFRTLAQLLSEGEIVDFLALGCERGVVSHLVVELSAFGLVMRKKLGSKIEVDVRRP